MGDGFCRNLCLRGEPWWCHSFDCLFSSRSYARVQVSSIAIIQFDMSFPSCWNRSRLIWHVLYRVHFCTLPNGCVTHFAQSLRNFKSFRKMWNTLNSEIPECVDNSATVQHLLSVKQCSITATCTSVWADSGHPLRGRSTVATCPCLKAFTQHATVRKATPYRPMLLIARHDTHKHFCHAEMQFLRMTTDQLYLQPLGY